MLSEEIYEKLIDMLMSGKLVSGDIINRRDIAAMLSVSVAPVLEAMLRLEHEGYLETIPRKGTIVKVIRKEDVLGNILIKTGIECIAARGYCGNKIKDSFERLLPLAQKLEDIYCSKGSCADVWRLDMEFHRALVDLCENSLLSKKYAEIAVPGLFYQLNSVVAGESPQNRSDHIRLLNSLITTDRDAAEAAIRNHLLSNKFDTEDYK